MDEVGALIDRLQKQNARLRAENEVLRKGINWKDLEEYACTGTDKPCGCYELFCANEQSATEKQNA
jgi:hypothetical protein